MPTILGLRELDGVWTSGEATSIKAVRRRLLVLGAGYVGVELAQAVCRLGEEAVIADLVAAVGAGEARFRVGRQEG